MMTASVRPTVFAYQDVLLFLKDTYKFRKHARAGFSYDVWAREMGISSRSYLRAMIVGSKPLQENLLPQLLKALSLNEEETSYFILLWRVNLAPTPELKAIYFKELFAAWKTQAQETTVPLAEEFLSDPLIPALFTYLSFDDHSSELKTIARDFNCDEERIQKALRCLIWNRLVDGSMSTDGVVHFKTVTPYFKVPSSPLNLHLKQFHVEGLKLSQAAAELPSSLRKIYSTFVALDEEQFKSAQALIADFNEKLVRVLENSSLQNKKIYRLNQQLFPVSGTVTASAPTVTAEASN